MYQKMWSEDNWYLRIKEDFLNSSSLASNSVVFRLRNRADRFLRFNLEHIVSLFLERIKLIYNTVVYLHYRLARGTPHACIKSHRSTPVTIDHCSCKLPSVWHFARRPCSPRVIRYLHISKRLYQRIVDEPIARLFLFPHQQNFWLGLS